ncbi:serine hydrolase [Mycoplasmatota bacterium zrk1]
MRKEDINNDFSLWLRNYFKNRVKKDKKIHNAYVLVHSEKYGIDIKLAEGTMGDQNVDPQQPIFIASIGKMFTSVLLGVLVEKKMVSFDDFLSSYLDEELLKDLHVYKGKDYTSKIKLKHLLNHTSGLYDYFEDKPKVGKSMLEIIIEEPDRVFTPREIVNWSKRHLTTHFPPGDGFHYSDVGYHLLGLVVEEITRIPFGSALNEFILKPLGMEHTYVLHYSRPNKKGDLKVAGVYKNDLNVISNKSLSCDYAGGGIVSTLDELLRFMKAIVKHEIIEKTTFELMEDYSKFSIGIEYGYGLMKIKTVPILMPRLFNSWGNIGSIGSFMFYHPKLDLYLIGNLNQFRYHSKGARLMFRIIIVLNKLLKKRSKFETKGIKLD